MTNILKVHHFFISMKKLPLKVNKSYSIQKGLAFLLYALKNSKFKLEYLEQFQACSISLLLVENYKYICCQHSLLLPSSN